MYEEYRHQRIYDAVEWVLGRPEWAKSWVRYLFRPWVIIRSLEEDNKNLINRLDALREAESEAGRHGLELYAENEKLREYEAIAKAQLDQFVTKDNYEALKKERDAYEKKAERVAALNEQMLKDWQNVL